MQPFSFQISDDSAALTTGAGKVTYRMPMPIQVVSASASLTIAQASGSLVTVNIRKNGTSILSTKITLDNTEKTSLTAAVPAVLSGASFDLDDELTIDVDQIGDGTAKGLKVTLLGYQPVTALASSGGGGGGGGGGGTATYVGWDPANKGTHVALTTGSDANSDASAASPSAWTSVRAALGRSSGKWYWEVLFVSGTGGAAIDQFIAGAALSTFPMIDGNVVGIALGSATASAGARSDNNVVSWTKAQTGAIGLAGAANDVVQFALDADLGHLFIGVNGTWKFSSNPATDVNPWVTGISGTVYPACSFYATTAAKIRLRTLSAQMSYAIPSGFTAWAG